jgi:hypothetical protein
MPELGELAFEMPVKIGASYVYDATRLPVTLPCWRMTVYPAPV